MRNTKSVLISSHRWLGLTFGLLGIWLAVTGAWLVLRPQLDPVMVSHTTLAQACTTPLPLDRIAAAAQAAYPQVPAESVWVKSDPRAATMVRFKDMNQAYVDGCTGKVLGQHHRYSGLFGFVEYLHRFRFAPTTYVAEWIGGIGAIVMAFGLATIGLYAWWPRRRAAVRASVTLNPALTGRARARNQHSVVGAVAALVIFVVAGTGVVQAFKPVEHLLYALSGTAPLKKPEVVDTPRGASAIETAWRGTVARMGAMPNSATIRLGGKGKPFEIYANAADAPHAEARTYAYADPATGAILRFVPYAATPTGERIYMWMLAFHMGMVGGPLGEALTLLAMLAIPFLGYTGLRSWWLRNRKDRSVPARDDSLSMRVVAVADRATGVRGIRLAATDGSPLPAFVAGGHIEVSTADGTRRAYSLVNGPTDRDAYEIGVRLVEEGRGGSLQMHRLAAGDHVTVARPRCHFALDAGASFSLLVAAGVGITPLLSMARHLAAEGQPFRLVYFGRDAAGMAYVDEVQKEFGARAVIHVGATRIAIPALVAEQLDDAPAGTHLYTCGPAGFMDMVLDEGRAAGLTEPALHREYFAADPATLGGPRAAFQLTLARSNRIVPVDEGTTILDALGAQGIAVPSSCEQGICGNCLTRVVSGEVDHRDSYLSTAEKARGDCMLICVSRAKGTNLVLDV